MPTFFILCVLYSATMALGADVGPDIRECRDTFHSCGSWSKGGMCDNEKFGFVMRGGCAKTCSFCTVKESIPGRKIHVSIPVIHTKADQDDNKNPTQIKVNQDKTGKKKKSDATPTTFTTITTATTPTTAATPTTATLATPASNIVVHVDRPIENADQPKKEECKDVLKNCKKWLQEMGICELPAFKTYMKYGCKKTCNLCDGSSAQRKAVIKEAPENLSNAAKKSLLELWPDDEDMDDDKIMHAVEMGITKAMSEELTHRSSKRNHVMRNMAPKKVKKAAKKGKAHRHSKHAHDVKRNHREKKYKIRRVEIETGYKNPRRFASFEEGYPLSSPDQQNSEAVNTFGRALNSADGLNSLAKLPDFDGINDVDSVQKLLETPKPNKKLEYYVDHFSKDPYVAYSEQQEWMKENDLHLKKYRRRLQKATKSAKKLSKKRHKTRKKEKRGLKLSSHLKSKKLEIENGSQRGLNAFSTEQIANGIAGGNSVFPEGQSLKPDFISHLRQLPYFKGFDKDDADKALSKAKLGKNFDYYVESFSKDPYLAESEREQWMKDNEIRQK